MSQMQHRALSVEHATIQLQNYVTFAASSGVGRFQISFDCDYDACRELFMQLIQQLNESGDIRLEGMLFCTACFQLVESIVVGY